MSVSGTLRWLRIYNWGGLNDKDATTIIGIQRAQEMRNVDLRREGILEKRYKVKEPYGGATSGYSANPIVGGFRGYSSLSGYAVKEGGTDDYSSTQYSKLMVWLQKGSNGNYHLVYGDDSTGAGTQLIDTGDTQLRQMRAVQWGDTRVYVAIQGAPAQYQFMQFGLNTDSDSPAFMHDARLDTVSDGTFKQSTTDAATPWDSDYLNKYFRCGVSLVLGPGGDYGQWAESPIHIFPQTVQLTDTDKYLRIEDITQPSTEYRQLRVYLTEPQDTEDDAEAAPLYLIAEIPYDNALSGGKIAYNFGGTTDWDYSKSPMTTADSGYPHSSGNTTINPIYIAKHNRRLYLVSAAERDLIWYSNLDKPNEFGENNNFELPEACRGMISFQGMLILAGENKIFAMQGWSPEDMSASLQVVVADRGVWAPDSLAVANIEGRPMLFFLTPTKQVWAFDGIQCHRVGYEVEGLLSTIDRPTYVRATVWRDKYYLAFTTNEDDEDYNTRVLCYDTNKNRWYHWDSLPCGWWIPWSGYRDNGELYWGDAGTDGRIFRVMDSGYEMCEFKYRTGDIPVVAPEVTVRLRKLRLEVSLDSLPLNVTLHLDGNRQSVSYSIPRPPSDARFDSATFGGFEFELLGSDMCGLTKSLEAGLHCRRVSLEIQSHTDTEVTVYGCSIGYEIKGRD